MWADIHRLAGAAVAAACLVTAAHAGPTDDHRTTEVHPLTVDDIVGLEAFDRADISPDGRWAIYEKRAGYDTMPRVEFGSLSTWTIMDLWLVDLVHPADPPRRLLAGEGLGLQRIAWSPSGRRLLITRLSGDDFEYGLVSMADRTVVWTGLTPDAPANGASAAWVSEDAVLLLTRPDGSLPTILRSQRDGTARRVAAWERTAAGLFASRTVVQAHGGVVTTEAAEDVQALVRLDLTTGERRTLAQGRIGDFSLSPDGRGVALVTLEEEIPLGRPEMVHMEDDRRHRLSILALAGGDAPRTLTGLDVAPHLLRWSPNSKAVLIWARSDGDRWSEGRLVSATAAGAEPFNQTGLNVGSSTEIVVAGVRADWLGQSPVLYARAGTGDRRDWHLLSRAEAPMTLTSDLRTAPTRIAAARQDTLYVFADEAYWAMTPRGLRRASTVPVPVREAIVFDLFAPRRLRSGEAPRRDWSVGIGSGGQLLRLAEGRRSQSLGSVVDRSGGGERVIAVSDHAVLVLRPTGLAETLALAVPGAEEKLDEVNATLADIVLTTPTPVRHADVSGHETTSWLFLPRGPVRGLIVKVYPGAADSLVRVDPLSMTYSTRPEVFVAAGYAYLSPSMPSGSTVRERGAVWTRSVNLALDAALAAFPALPANRMVLWGHSFGGYSALEIATRSDRFRAYIASSSYSDMPGVWGEFDPGGRIQPEDGGFFRFDQGWTEVGQGALGAPPWVDPDLYETASPFLRADRITRPVLLMTADMDFAPMSQAERMFSAILRNGGDARMVTYWGEQHLLWSPANIRDYYGEIFGWLGRTLAEPVAVSPQVPDAAPTSEPSPPSRQQ